MKTSNYHSTKKPGIVPTNLGAISISLYPPRWAKYKRYAPLAPRNWFYKEPKDIYIPAFKEHLALLDAGQVWEDLHSLSEGSEPIILCYEVIPPEMKAIAAASLPEDAFCHRRMVAEWLEDRLGIKVEEL